MFSKRERKKTVTFRTFFLSERKESWKKRNQGRE
jgi:hypothetical protein